MSYYTPANEVVGVYWFHHGCLSVRPSVCSWIPPPASEAVGGYTDWLAVRLSVERWFPHDNSITFWHTMMILKTWVYHNPRRTSIDFGVNRSKVKVKFGLKTLYRFRTITPGTITFSNTMMILHTWVDNDPRRTSIDFWVNRSRSHSDYKLCTVSTRKLHYLLTYNNDTSHMSWSWPKLDLYRFWRQ